MARKKSRPDFPSEGDSSDDASSDFPGDPPVGSPMDQPPGEALFSGAPVEPNPAVPTPAVEPIHLPILESRIEQLEKALAPLRQLEGLEERLLQRVSAAIDRAQPPANAPSTTPSDTSIIQHASALGEAGRHLLKSFVLPGSPTAASVTPPPRVAARPWAIREILAEGQAMFYMFVDPRYRLSWPGRVIPLILLGLFLTTGWWVKYALCGLGELFRKPIELLLCFALLKLLGYEARRYRESAPDLPSSMR